MARAYTQSQIKAYHRPWEKLTGNKVNSEDYNGGLAEIRAQVLAGNVTWDVIDVETRDAVRGCDEGLLETIDPSTLPPAPDGTPATEDFIDGTLIECAVASIVWSTIIAYDTTNPVFKDEKPKTINDLFDTKKFPGRRALRKVPALNLEWALMADGVPNDKIYETLSTPAGVDRAFAKLDTIKDDLLWWEAGAQPPQMLADGEAIMVSAYNGRIFKCPEPGEEALRHHLGRPDLGPRLLCHRQGHQEAGTGAGLPQVRRRHPAQRRPGQVHLLWPGAEVGHEAGLDAC